MNFQTLQYFLTLANLKHYTLAANSLYITQSALSKSIHNLEEELNVPLFLRDGRNVVLSKYGETFLHHIQRAADEIEQGRAAVQKMADYDNNVVSLVALYSMYATYLPDIILKFRQQNPEVDFALEYKVTSVILSDILSDKASLGICSNFNPYQDAFSTLERHLIRKENLVTIVSKMHPLADKKNIRMEDLKDEQFIVYRWNNFGLNSALRAACHKAGFDPKIICEAFNDYNILGQVSAGKGVAVISDQTPMDLSNVCVLHFQENIPTRSLFLIWRKDLPLSPATQKFRNFIIQGDRNEA